MILSADGLVFEAQTWDADGDAGVVWRVRLPRGAMVEVVPFEAVRPIEELVAQRAGSWAAINGGFYEDGPMGLVVHEGVEIHALTAVGGSGVLFAGPGPAAIVHRDAWGPGAREALQSIDRLVDNGVSLVSARSGAHHDARSAIAIGGDSVWLVAAASAASIVPVGDGVRLQGTAGRGLTLSRFAELLVSSLGAEQALNLDGAVSTQMIVQAGETRWVLHGERGTINAVVVGPK